MPENIFADCFHYFDQLISREKNLGRSAAISLQESCQNGLRFTGMEATALESICNKFNSEELVEWRINYFCLRQLMLPSQSVQKRISKVFEGTWWLAKNRILGYLSLLEGLMYCLESRLHANRVTCLETAIESSLFDQAQQLFESQTHPIAETDLSMQSYDFIVVSIVGSVLERILQILCIQYLKQVPAHQEISESIVDRCLLALEDAGVVDPAIAAQISVWLSMREQVLRGNVEHLDRTQVEEMIEGTRNFLDESLRDVIEDICDPSTYSGSALLQAAECSVP